jgi:hypothetical protein
MFGLGFFKGQPTEHIIKYVGGKIMRQGRGLTFFYFRHNTQIAAIPVSSTDRDFIFNEVTSNFQAVTLQGRCTYRVKNPELLADLLNFTVDPKSKLHTSEDPDLLADRITNVIQMETRSEIHSRSLEETLRESEKIAHQVLERVKEKGLLEPMGIELISIYFLAARPTPEVSKALEAEYRETLLRKADEAIYARRASAVEEERKIKEKELNTQVSLEQRRQELISLQGENAMQEAENRGKAREKEAEYKARAMEMELGFYRTFDSQSTLALGFRDLAQNAAKIGNLTITSEILGALLDGKVGAKK